jgi:hypothetical protein
MAVARYGSQPSTASHFQKLLAGHVAPVGGRGSGADKFGDRLIAHNLKQLLEFHTRMIPYMAYYCNRMRGCPTTSPVARPAGVSWRQT